MNCRNVLKSGLVAIVLTAGAVAGHGAKTPPWGRNIYVGTIVSPGFTRFQFTGAEESDWVTDEHGSMKCMYDANQGWGTAFIMASNPSYGVQRATIAVSPKDSLCVDLKGEYGGEMVNVGVKTDTDPDNGKEPRYIVKSLTKSWHTYKIPLSTLVQSPDYPTSRFSHLYVVFELGFMPGNTAETVWYRNVKYTR
jgi:hypothetical protein